MRIERRREQVEKAIEVEAHKGRGGGIFSFFNNRGILGCLDFGKERKERTVPFLVTWCIIIFHRF
jgi:hypothetical protein